MSEENQTPESENRFGHYHVLSDEEGGPWTLSRGAFDATFKAVDTHFECPVALRVLDLESANVGELKAAFIAEAKLTAALHHSGIATALALDPTGNQPCVAFEFVKGEGLESLLAKTGPLSPSASLGVIEQMASMLHALWQSGLAHPGLSISSFTLFYECEEMRLKLTDLRLCKTGTVSRLARPDPIYQSPEQAAGKPPDIRSNLFSIGKIYCRLLGVSVDDLRALDQADGLASCGALRALPKGVVELVGKLLASDPTKRIQTPFDLRSLIARSRGDSPAKPVEARAATVDEPSPKAVPSVSRRFHPGRSLDGGLGRFTECDDADTGQTAVIHFFSADEEVSRIHAAKRVAGLLIAHPHNHILKPIEIAPEEADHLLAYEDPGSRRLLDSLRRQRKLMLAESLGLLDQVAMAIDHAVKFDIHPIPLTPATIRLSFEKGVEGTDADGWSAAPLSKLPGLTAKLVPFGALPEADFAFDAGAESETGSLKEKMLCEFGWLVHELLGGARPRIPVRTQAAFIPLASLSEAGNTALKRVLFPGETQAFSSATAFIDELRSTTELDVVPTPAPVPRQRAAAPAPYSESSLPSTTKRAPIVVSDEGRIDGEEGSGIGRWVLLSLVFLILLLIAGAVFVLWDGFGLAPGLRERVEKHVPFELPEVQSRQIPLPGRDLPEATPEVQPIPDTQPDPTPAGTPSVIQMPLPPQPGGSDR